MNLGLERLVRAHRRAACVRLHHLGEHLLAAVLAQIDLQLGDRVRQRDVVATREWHRLADPIEQRVEIGDRVFDERDPAAHGLVALLLLREHQIQQALLLGLPRAPPAKSGAPALVAVGVQPRLVADRVWPRVDVGEALERVPVPPQVALPRDLPQTHALAAHHLLVGGVVLEQTAARTVLRIVTHRYTPLHTVTHRCIPLHAVTCRYITLHAVTRLV